MQQGTKSIGWCTAFTFWVLGAFILLKISSSQKSMPDPLLVTFYILALFPIKYCIDRLLHRRRLK